MKFIFKDIAEKLVKETSYRARVDELEPFHEQDDKLWFEIEFERVLNDLGKLFGNLLEKVNDGLEVKDQGGTTEQQQSLMGDTLNQVMLQELLNKWYAEKGKAPESLERYYVLLKNQMYNFRLKPNKHQHYPREDQGFWGDDYDLRKTLEDATTETDD